jgi:hypothetical protein
VLSTAAADQAAADALAAISGGSDYKFLIGLNPRLPRTYLRAAA